MYARQYLKCRQNNTLGTNTSGFVPLPIGPLALARETMTFGHARSAAAAIVYCVLAATTTHGGKKL